MGSGTCVDCVITVSCIDQSCFSRQQINNFSSVNVRKNLMFNNTYSIPSIKYNNGQDGTGTRLVTGGGLVIVGRSRAVLVGQEESTYVVTAGTGAGQVIVGHFLVEHDRGGV